jgi:protein-S-isoprenylcysteine O-methyltransferase Ste14
MHAPRQAPDEAHPPAAVEPAVGGGATIAGTYGTGGHLAVPLGLCAAALAGHLWHHGGRPVPWELAWLAGLVAQVLIRWPHIVANRANLVRERRLTPTDRALLGGMFLTMVPLPLIAFATPWLDAAAYTLPWPAALAGALLLLPACWLFHRSHADLGRNWSPTLEIRQSHGLVTQGVYARLRHPMYAAIWLFALAQPLLVQNAAGGLPLVVACALLYFVRVPKEEAMMRETFGSAWDAYAARTGRLWPRWRPAAAPGA